MIQGVRITPLRQIPDERGCVMHMLREDAAHFERFGEIYFSWVYPGAIKGWRLHHELTLNYAVPVGRVKLVVYDDRAESTTQGELMELFLGDARYELVTVPPRVWSGITAVGTQSAMVANCSTIPYRADEIVYLDPFSNTIPYSWELRHSK